MSLSASCSTGTSVLKPRPLATASTTFPYQESVIGIRDQGSSAPSAIESRRLIIRSGSNSMRTPNPVHAGHAPCGELKLKLRGSSSSMV